MSCVGKCRKERTREIAVAPKALSTNSEFDTSSPARGEGDSRDDFGNLRMRLWLQ